MLTFDKVEIAFVVAVGRYYTTTLRPYRALYVPGAQVRYSGNGSFAYVLTTDAGEVLQRGTFKCEAALARIVNHSGRTLDARLALEDDRDDCGSVCNFCGGNGCFNCNWQGVNAPIR